MSGFKVVAESVDVKELDFGMRRDSKYDAVFALIQSLPIGRSTVLEHDGGEDIEVARRRLAAGLKSYPKLPGRHFQVRIVNEGKQIAITAYKDKVEATAEAVTA